MHGAERRNEKIGMERGRKDEGTKVGTKERGNILMGERKEEGAQLYD